MKTNEHLNDLARQHKLKLKHKMQEAFASVHGINSNAILTHPIQ